MPLWIRGYRKRGKKLASLLHWDAMETPSILKQRDGSVLATMQLAGPDLASALDIELVAQASTINTLFRRYGSRWGFQTEVRRWEIRDYPYSTWPNWLSAKIDEERRAQWAQGGHFTNEVHLNVAYKPLNPVVQGWQKFVYENLPDDEDPDAVHRQDFAEELERLKSMFKTASMQADLLEDADLLTYLHRLVSTKQHRVGVPEPACYLNSYLTDMDLYPGIYPRLGHEEDAHPIYIGCLRPHVWTQDTYPGIFEVLDETPIEYRATVRYIPMDKQEAVSKAHKNAQQWESKKVGGAEDRAKEANECWRRLDNGDFSYGMLTPTVVVWDTTLQGLKRKFQLVEGAFNNASMVVKRESLNTMDAWIGTLPGELYANPCQEPLHSFNFAHFFPATSTWKGQQWNTHLNGPSVFHATGKGKSSVGISLYEGDVGHFGLIGSTGDGKSTFLNFLCTQQLRYAEQEIWIFDKQYAALRLTAAMNGLWYDLGQHPLQPLANLDRPGEIPWAVDWLEAVMLQERVHVTPEMKGALHQALLKLAEWEQKRRTISILVETVEDRRVKQTLGLYTKHGPYGQVTDGDTDGIGDNTWLCFELTSILETPNLLNAILPALMHRLEQRLTGVPVLQVHHEGWIALDTPYWEGRLRSHFKGMRTRNCAIGLTTQSLANAVRSKIMPDILDNVVSWIFTPNRHALSEEHQKLYRLVGLNERQCELLAHGTKKRDYYLVQPSGCSMFQLDLGPLALEVCSTPYAGEIAALQAQIAQHGTDFGRWYLAEKGLL